VINTAMRVDLLHLLRNLRRSPASAAAAILTLSLTLGVGAAIFAVVDAVLLTPPPFADPDALVLIGEVPIEESSSAPRTVGYATFLAWRDRAGSLATLEGTDGTNLVLTGLGPVERLRAANVTTGYFRTLGIAPALGRVFSAEDEAQPVAVVSGTFWRGKLNADPAAIGRPIVLGGQAHTIVGVLPERFPSDRDVWRPIPVAAAQAVRAGYRVGAIARLASGVSASQIERALNDVSRTSVPPARASATAVTTELAGRAAGTLTLLAGAAALALLIAFVNLAGLLVVRSIDRQRELAVRSALGAGRSAIARQLLLEAETLVIVGTVGGVLLALWLTPLAGQLTFEQFGAVANRELAISWRVIALVSCVAAMCAGCCGALPALLAARRNVVDVLRRGATPPPRELMLRRAFVVAEVAIAFVLLVSLTLVGRSLLNVLRVHPGFDANGVLALQVTLSSASYPDQERVVSFYSALDRALAERLGPGAAGIIDEIPLGGNGGRRIVRARPSDAGHEVVMREASPAYFDVMRIPLVAGRHFDPRDDGSAPLRAVISQSLAARLFASEPSIGRQLLLGANAQPVEVVGVAGDVKHRTLDEAALATVYLSAWQAESRGRIVVVRSPRPDADVSAVVREEVARLDRDVPVYAARPLPEIVAASPGMPARRVLTATFGGFALLALLLGAIGLFAVVTHDVASRRVELALRMALGADPIRLGSATLGQGAVMVGFGLALGGGLSIWTARVLSGFVVGAGSLDVVSVGLPAVLLLVLGSAAVLPAARRAARTNPLLALRSE
jgi:predicted permease